MKSHLSIVLQLSALAWGLFGTAVYAAPPQPEWELQTIDRNPVPFPDNNKNLASIARIVVTGKNKISYDYFEKNKPHFTMAFDWSDPPARVKAGETVRIPMGARLAKGKGKFGMRVSHMVLGGDKPQTIQFRDCVGGYDLNGNEMKGAEEFTKKFGEHDQDVTICVFVGHDSPLGRWTVTNYTYKRIDHPRADAQAGPGSGSAGPFAGKFDTTIGPVVIRVTEPWASGVIPNVQTGFNGRVSGTTLEGKTRSPNGTGTIRITLADTEPRLRGVITTDGSSTVTNFTGTAVAPGNPVEVGQPVRTDKLTFQSPERWVRPGDTFQVPLWMLNGKGLGALVLELSYDPKVIQPVPPPIKGNLITGAPAQINFANETGRAYIGFFDTRGLPAPPTGTLSVLQFKAVGKVGDHCPLALNVTTLNMANGTQPKSEKIEGMVRVVASTTRGKPQGEPPQLPPPPGPPPAGPGNGPGSLQPPSQPPVPPHTLGDAETALKMAVRLIPENLSLDVTGEGPNSGPDGKVTARDAQVIAQRAIQGAINSPVQGSQP